VEVSGRSLLDAFRGQHPPAFRDVENLGRRMGGLLLVTFVTHHALSMGRLPRGERWNGLSRVEGPLLSGMSIPAHVREICSAAPDATTAFSVVRNTQPTRFNAQGFFTEESRRR